MASTMSSATHVLLGFLPKPNPRSTVHRLLNGYPKFFHFSNSKFRTLRLQATLDSSATLTKESEAKETDSLTLREICRGHVPEHVLNRAEEVGYVVPTDVQKQALPVLFDGRDCILHAQTGSGKTLAYLLLIFSAINPQSSTVQALIVVPTRELGMQVTKVARMLAAKPVDDGLEQKPYSVMALLDGGKLRRQKTWLKAEPPMIVVATIASLCELLDRQIVKLQRMKALVIDEVDFMFNSAKQVSSVRKLLTSYSSCNSRQTVLASASIPQHNRFLHDCIQQKWTKNDVVHVHVNAIQPMPSCLQHRFVLCTQESRHQTLLSLLQSDAPKTGIIFVGEQTEKSKKSGNAPSASILMDFLKTSYQGCLEILLLVEDMNFNLRAASLSVSAMLSSFLQQTSMYVLYGKSSGFCLNEFLFKGLLQNKFSF